MLARVRSAAVVGLDASIVDVEVDVSPGIPTFAIVGLPDTGVREARERVRAAIRNSGYEMPVRRITVNLAPADTRKEGSVFDLPIALGILAATRQLPPDPLGGLAAVGELSLDGTVRAVPGVLSIALALGSRDGRGLLVPEANAEEAGIVRRVPVHPVASLREIAHSLRGLAPLRRLTEVAMPEPTAAPSGAADLAEVRGQAHVRRALEIAAAGAHNILMVGPPGAGKTMLARRLPTILPPLTSDEAIEVTRIYSVCGRLPSGHPLITVRSFRAPHHGVSLQALVGGGAVPRPGEVSLAHLGVLFLDELPEFRRDVLEALRQPIEEGLVTVSRVHGSVTFPARCMVVAAMNPCPCGHRGGGGTCDCSPARQSRYVRRLSGPLIDRIDLHVEVPRLTGAELTALTPGEASRDVRARVVRARAIQARRGAGWGIAGLTNGTIPAALVRRQGELDAGVVRFLRQAIDRLALSPRAYERVLRVARTIADLDAAEEVRVAHVAEALQYRTLDRGAAGPGPGGDP